MLSQQPDLVVGEVDTGKNCSLCNGLYLQKMVRSLLLIMSQQPELGVLGAGDEKYMD